jgi:hypothetical protein
VQNAQSLLSASPHVNASLFISSVLIAAEAAFASAESGLKTELLNLLETAAQSQASVDGTVTSTIAGILYRLSADLTASQSNTLLGVAAAVTNRSTAITQQAGNTMLSVLESASPGKNLRYMVYLSHHRARSVPQKNSLHRRMPYSSHKASVSLLIIPQVKAMYYWRRRTSTWS